MHMKHDQLTHLRNLRLLLSQEKSPIGFLLAAGCPQAVKDKDNNPLLPDMAGLSKIISNDHIGDADDSPYKRLISELEKGGKNLGNVEDVLTFIRSMKDVSIGGGLVRGFTEIELNKLEKDFCDKIAKAVNKALPNGENAYRKLAKWISSIDRAVPVEIFTTNYDLLMEQALEEQYIPFFDGFTGSRSPFFDIHSVQKNDIPPYWARLWKLHGSINWKLEGRNIFRVSKDMAGSPELIYPSKLKYDQSRKMPFLAMSDRLTDFLLRSHAVLIVCGYSFNDEHINDTIINALKVNQSANVIVLMYGKMLKPDGNLNSSEAFYRAKERPNLCVWYDDKAIIATQDLEWSEFDNNNKDFADFSLKIVDRHVSLGDFESFTSFLYQLIGELPDDEK